MKDKIKVKLSYIVESIQRIEVEVPISSLSKDENGIYSGDEIQNIANKLALKELKKKSPKSHHSLDEFTIVEKSLPEDFEYWM